MPYQSEVPSPTITANEKKEEEEKTAKSRNGVKSEDKKKNIGPALKTHQSYPIEYRVTEIVSQGYLHGNKSHAVLRGSSTRSHTRIPICDQALRVNCTDIYRTGRAQQIECKNVHQVTFDRIQH